MLILLTKTLLIWYGRNTSIKEITKELILQMLFWSWSWIVREPRVLWMYMFLCQAPVPSEHLSSCNAVIIGLYSLDLLSWSTDSLWTGDREQKDKKSCDCLTSGALVRFVNRSSMDTWSTGDSDLRSDWHVWELSCSLSPMNCKWTMWD